MSRRVLITGASIAGNAAAWWLTRSGNEVTVVERAPGFRQGGQGIDVQNLGLQVVDLMGMREEIRRRGTGETGMALVRSDNRPFAEFGIGYGLTNEFEILRDDLAKAFYEPASTMAEYRFGDAIAAVDNRQDGAAVTFRSGRQETFDCVVVAEGVGSATREMLFPGENDPDYLDMTIAYFTIPGGPTDSRQARWFPAKGGMRSWFGRIGRVSAASSSWCRGARAAATSYRATSSAPSCGSASKMRGGKRSAFSMAWTEARISISTSCDRRACRAGRTVAWC